MQKETGRQSEDSGRADAGPISVDDYLRRLPEDARDALQHVRSVVQAMVPGVRERIAYGVVVFSADRDLVGMASQKRFCSFYTMSPALVKRMVEELDGHAVYGATLHFEPRAPLPDTLIETILQRRLEEVAWRRSRPR